MSVSIVAEPIYDAGYTRALLFVGTFLTVLGMMMTSISKTYWEVMLAQGVTVGVGCGLLFLPSMVIMSQYLTTKMAFATGIASTGSSLGEKSPLPERVCGRIPGVFCWLIIIGAVIYPIIIRQLQPRIGFGWAVRTIAFIMLSSSIISLPFMRHRIPAAAVRKMSDLAALKEKPYLFCMFVASLAGG